MNTYMKRLHGDKNGFLKYKCKSW